MIVRNRVFLLFLILVFGCDPEFTRGQSIPLTTSPDRKEWRTETEQQAFYLVNAYRKDHDFPPLVWNAGLASLARQHSADMASGACDFGHDGFGDRVKLAKALLPGLRGAGENVFMADDPLQIAEHAVDTWLHSPPHLHNIRGDFNYSGLGVWENSEGRIYFTQFFSKVVTPPVSSDN